jgi:hypothetical protein
MIDELRPVHDGSISLQGMWDSLHITRHGWKITETRLRKHPAGEGRSRLLKCILDARGQLLVAPDMEQEISVTDKVALF